MKKKFVSTILFTVRQSIASLTWGKIKFLHAIISAENGK